MVQSKAVHYQNNTLQRLIEVEWEICAPYIIKNNALAEIYIKVGIL